MTITCPDPTGNTFSIDQSVTVPDLLNKGTNSDVSLNGGSAMTATVQFSGSDIPRPDCVVITWSVAEDSTTAFNAADITLDSTTAPTAI